MIRRMYTFLAKVYHYLVILQVPSFLHTLLAMLVSPLVMDGNFQLCFKISHLETVI